MTEVFGKESAKAIGKVADASNNAVEASRQFGQWLSKHCGQTLEQGFGLWADKFYYRRIEGLLDFMENTGRRIEDLRLEGKLRSFEMKIVIPLLEAVSLESDIFLRELWENLLVNSVNDDVDKPHPAFIQILQNLKHEEAKILKYMNEASINISVSETDYGCSGPSLEDSFFEIAIAAGIHDPQEPVISSWFDNLLRLRLLESESTHETLYDDGQHCLSEPPSPSVKTYYTKEITLTAFGHSFIGSVTK